MNPEKTLARKYRTNPLPFQVALASLERQMAEHLERQGERLRQARKALGLSQEGAAQLIGVSSKAYGDWERGKSEPRDGNWKRIEQQLAVTALEVRGEPPATQLDRIESDLAATRVELGAMATQLEDLQRLTARIAKTVGVTTRSRKAN